MMAIIALVTRWPAVRLVMLEVGFITSANEAWRVRFDAMLNWTVALLVMRPPIQFVATVQLVTMKPAAGVAAMV